MAHTHKAQKRRKKRAPAEEVAEVEEEELEGHEALVEEGALALAARGRDDVHGQRGEDGKGDDEDEEDGRAGGAQEAEHVPEGQIVVREVVDPAAPGRGPSVVVVAAAGAAAAARHGERWRGVVVVVVVVVAAAGVGGGVGSHRVRLGLCVLEQEGARALLGQYAFQLLLPLLLLQPVPLVAPHHIHQRCAFSVVP